MPNFDNIQYEAHRRQVDPKYLELIKELDEAYYKHWKKGESHPFEMNGVTFDKQDTSEASKVLFDKIHGSIWQAHEKELIELNETMQDAPNERSAHNGYIVDDNGNPVLDAKGMKQPCKINQDDIDPIDEATQNRKKQLLVEKLAEKKTKENITVVPKTLSEAQRKKVTGETLTEAEKTELGISSPK